MPDFLDRFGDQLHAAQPVTPLTPGAVSAAARKRIGRRGFLATGAVLALAAPAVAVVSSWDPALERPGVDRPVSTDASPVSPTAVNAIAALRREQTPADRAGAAPLVRAIGMGNQVDRVQTEGIRIVAPGWALVPAKSVQTGPGRTATDQLCLTDGQQVGCSAADTVTRNGVGILSATANQTSLTGVVPDGISRVRFTPEDGKSVEVPVEENFYELSVAQARTGPPVSTPEDYAGPATIPGPSIPAAGTLTWLDSDGEAVGPAEPRLG